MPPAPLMKLQSTGFTKAAAETEGASIPLFSGSLHLASGKGPKKVGQVGELSKLCAPK